MKGKRRRVLLLASGDTSALEQLLKAAGCEPSLVSSPEAALDRADGERFDVVVLDLGASQHGAFVRAHADRFPEVPLIAVVSDEDGAEATALGDGAAEAVSRSRLADELAPAVERALARSASVVSGPPPPSPTDEAKLLGVSPKIERVRAQIARVGPGAATVLIRGETGTGKELVARAIHEASERRSASFIKTHVAALPDALLESELFGYEKGAFTGAVTRKPGRVELAEGGTLFLDEIGEISPVVQAKLLRLVQDREYERLGGTRTLKANVRFITATHRDLEHMTELGTFREDLFYRLNVVSVWLPPLRARREDIPLLVTSHARRISEQGKRPPLEFDASAIELFRSQRWPGNVRQLLNLVERLVVLAPAPVLSAAHVQSELEEQVAFSTQASQSGDAVEAVAGSSAKKPLEASLPSSVRPLRVEVERAERRAIEKALTSAKGNRTLAARMLGVSRRTLYTKLEELGIE